MFPVFQTAQWLTSLHPSRHLCPQSEFLLKKKNVEKLEKVLRRKKNLLEFPQESPPRDSGVSSVNRSVDAGRSCLLYSTKSRTQAHSGYQTRFRPWVTASLPEGPARPTAITTLPSILHSPLTNLSLHYVFSPKFPVVSFGHVPKSAISGSKGKNMYEESWHR